MPLNDVKQIWQLPQSDFSNVRAIAAEHNLPPIITEILIQRGHNTSKEIGDFLAPTKLPLSSPYDLDGIKEAVKRIEKAKEQSEHIRVIGDYDVDGIAGTALMVRALQRYGMKNVSYGIPNRMTDGYGLNSNIVEQAFSDAVSLIITVDNGISAVDAAETATEKNIDLIITDHHSLPEILPKACAVINPKKGDPSHPFYQACGTAVAYKLAEALNEKQYDLSLVALATIADIVPLQKENRTLTALGLSEIQNGFDLAISTLAQKSKTNLRELRAEHIAFQIAPRINASGRIGTGYNALELLLSENPEEMEYLASELESINTERRNIEAGIYEEAFVMSQDQNCINSMVAILASKNWHPGVIGIAASKLMYKLSKPVFLVAIDDDGIGRGSGRSTHEFNLVNGLNNASKCLMKFGGHQAAAGFTIQADELENLREIMETQAQHQEVPKNPVRKTIVDAILSFTDITNDLLYSLDRLEPYGKDNPTPIFATYGVELVSNTFRTMKGNHMRCVFKQSGRTFPAIGFNMADTFEKLLPAKKFDITYTPNFNNWKGETQIQLQLKEIKTN